MSGCLCENFKQIAVIVLNLWCIKSKIKKLWKTHFFHSEAVATSRKHIKLLKNKLQVIFIYFLIPKKYIKQSFNRHFSLMSVQHHFFVRTTPWYYFAKICVTDTIFEQNAQNQNLIGDKMANKKL